MREYFAVYTRVAKPPKVVAYLKIIRKRDPNFFLLRLASILRPVTFICIYLIRARKMPAVAINGSFTGRRPE